MVACGPVRIVRTVLLICAAGCASRRSGAPAGAAPAGAPPAPHESLHVTVTYPAATDVIQAHDSSFLFGTVRVRVFAARVALRFHPPERRGARRGRYTGPPTCFACSRLPPWYCHHRG